MIVNYTRPHTLTYSIRIRSECLIRTQKLSCTLRRKILLFIFVLLLLFAYKLITRTWYVFACNCLSVCNYTCLQIFCIICIKCGTHTHNKWKYLHKCCLNMTTSHTLVPSLIILFDLVGMLFKKCVHLRPKLAFCMNILLGNLMKLYILNTFHRSFSHNVAGMHTWDKAKDGTRDTQWRCRK